jgi:hypothetical protein
MTEPEMSRKNCSTILRAIAERGSNAAAEGWGLSASRFCHMKNDREHPLIEGVAGMLAALGLKVVEADAQTYSPDVIKALHTMARLGFELSPEMVEIKGEN